MKYFTVSFTLLLVTGVVVAALLQNTVALIAVGAGSATLFIVVGAGIVVAFQKITGDAEHRRFRENEKENLRLIQETQKAQNLMIRGFSSQMRLPTSDSGSPDFFITDGVFNELE